MASHQVPSMPNLQDNPLVFTTAPMPLGHIPTSWLELALQDKQLTFQVMIAGQPVTLILQDPLYLA
ncbi:hypothetical protein R3W88_016819 [Solanum pinnatisectum]|uniref:Uncharacterized protein n=1 Tax=Solanum pinnatisectum TaxID=50273 RepID=A0AAV9KYE3_9SOLN|nr:hypothetical protein R3W88_016819 [Solanum pinnatisectum]